MTNIKWFGRNLDDKEGTNLYHTGSGFYFNFKGSKVIIELKTKCIEKNFFPFIKIIIDGKTDEYEINTNTSKLTFDLEEGKHTFEFRKRTEAIDSSIKILNIKIDGEFLPLDLNYEFNIEVVGDSTCTGFANLGKLGIDEKSTKNSDGLLTPMYKSAKILNADINIFAASGWGIKFSPWTEPNSMNLFDNYQYVTFKSKNKWDFNSFIPNVIILSFGTNDASYINLSSTEEEKEERIKSFKNQYLNFINFIHSKYKNAKIIMLYGLMCETNNYNNIIDIYEKAKMIIDDLEIIKLDGDMKAPGTHPTYISQDKMTIKLVDKIKTIRKKMKGE